MKKILAAACLCLALVAGCKKTETTPEKPQLKGSLLIGLSPEQTLFTQLERYEPLAGYLSRKLGTRIELTVLPRYGSVINGFVTRGLDGAFFGSFTYVLAHVRLNLEVLARPEKADGISTYHGIIFVRKDSGIRGIEDMRGKRFAFVDKATTAGYLLPLYYFKKNGIKDYMFFLKEAYFTGTHEDAVYDVLNGKADIGAAKSTVFERLAEADEGVRNNLVVLATSPEVPENALAVRKTLDGPVKEKLKAVLLAMHEDPEGRAILEKFGAARFIETTDGDYEPVFRYAREVGINLATYNYIGSL
jgi:phosphonate transport system substrate-binding protein